MQKYAVLLSYEGTQYCGWQKQLGSAAGGAPSIQSTIEAILHKITGEEPSLVGSGRTDAGVHAVGQVAHFRLSKKDWDPLNIQRGLNSMSMLPIDIRALSLQKVDIDFHAQRSAEKKQYSYYFQQGPCAIPHLEPYSWWIHKKLNTEAMQTALDHLKGEHDFKPFQSTGAKPGGTVRTILEAEVTRERAVFPGIPYPSVEFVRVRLVGTGFLKQMVRGIAGTLLQIGENRRSADDVQAILSSQDRSTVGPTAPARALWLERVWYPEKYALFPHV